MSETVIAAAGTEPLENGSSLLGRRRLFFVVLALLVAQLLAALDQTIFATALPTVVGDLGGVDLMLWVGTAYMLASTIMMPIYGKIGDLFGRRTLLIGALGLFLAGSVLGGLADQMSLLIAARAIQGLGGGGLMTLSLGVIADIAPARRRGNYMTILGTAWALASVLGPILGGWFSDSIGWRWAFWFNLPLGTLAVASALLFLRVPVPSRAKTRLDTEGMAGIAVVSTAIILVVSWGGGVYPWRSPVILGLITLAVVSGLLLLLIERRATEPIIPLSLFRDRNFNLSTAGGLLCSVAFFGVIMYMPTYLQMVTGLTATSSGLLMIPMCAGMQAGAIGSGMAASRTGRYKWLPLASSLLMAVSLYLLSTMTVGSSLWSACFYLFLCGLGMGLGFQTLVLVVQNSFPLAAVGTATGTHNFFRQIGASLGSAVIGTVFTNRLFAVLPQRLASVGATSGIASDANSLTPALVGQMPEGLKSIVIISYNEALAPVYLYLVPLAVLALLLFALIKEKALATTNEILSEAPLSVQSTKTELVPPVQQVS